MTSLYLDLLGAQIKRDDGSLGGRYAEAGDPDQHALILLHGHGGHLEGWAKNIVPYGERFHVFALDVVWHGLGPQPEFDVEAMPTMLAHILDFMDRRGIERTHLEGQSMGGWIALNLALHHPDRVARLVLTTAQGFHLDLGDGAQKWPAGRVPRDPLEPIAADDVELPTADQFLSRMRELNVEDPEVITQEMAELRHRLYRDPLMRVRQEQFTRTYSGVRFDADTPAAKWVLHEADLRKIGCPTLVCWGANNSFPVAYGERLAELIPDARLHCQAGARQWVQYEFAGEHNRLVLSFLDG